MKRSPVPRPFLKWAGGKGQLLAALRRCVRGAMPFLRYHEPFVGGGALFFDLWRSGVLAGKEAFLSDNNASLIDAYRGVKEDVEGVIRRLQKHAAVHGEEHYYAVRSEVPRGRVARAARIIYLNKTCYNGLFRENSRGEFNVPMGRYVNPAICDVENLRAVAAALSGVEVSRRHFREILETARAGDFVYFDPPYHPVSKTSSFTGYDKGRFGEEDQRELARVFAALSARGVKVLLSNSMTPLVRELYRDFRIEAVYATRAVNSLADRRGKIAEALVRNF